LFDEEGSKIIQKVMDKAKEKNVQIHLPVDVVTGSKFAEDATVGSATVESGITGDAMVSYVSRHSGTHQSALVNSSFFYSDTVLLSVVYGNQLAQNAFHVMLCCFYYSFNSCSSLGSVFLSTATLMHRIPLITVRESYGVQTES